MEEARRKRVGKKGGFAYLLLSSLLQNRFLAVKFFPKYMDMLKD